MRVMKTEGLWLYSHFLHTAVASTCIPGYHHTTKGRLNTSVRSCMYACGQKEKHSNLPCVMWQWVASGNPLDGQVTTEVLPTAFWIHLLWDGWSKGVPAYLMGWVGTLRPRSTLWSFWQEPTTWPLLLFKYVHSHSWPLTEVLIQFIPLHFGCIFNSHLL